MFFKGVIFDLDDTLYDHKICELKAYKKVANYLEEKYNYYFYDDLAYHKDSLKKELFNTAASHNRFIYFKKTLENNKNIPYSEVINVNDIYWQEFYDNMKLRYGVMEFFDTLREYGKKIIILTNYQTEYQFKKLKKLNILDKIDHIITSEEVGVEKPSFKIFDEVIRESGIKKEDLIMTGDSFKFDVNGANDYGMYSFYYNKEFHNFTRMYSRFNSFADLNFIFKSLHKDLNDFSKMAKDFSSFDLVQLGGGNISIKNKNLMIIKSSGAKMGDINMENGYSIVNNNRLLEDLMNDEYENLNCYRILNSKNKPSIETYMHSILRKYTVHLHPISINKILVRKNAREKLREKYPKSVIIDYFSPGEKVCKEIIKTDYQKTKIFFLLNHGVIFTSDNLEEIYSMVDDIRINTTLDIVSNDIYLNNKIELVKKYYDKYAFPDAVVYLKDKYKVIDDKIYLKSKNLEEILKANIMILEGEEEINFLKEEEINSLINREDENFRINKFGL